MDGKKQDQQTQISIDEEIFKSNFISRDLSWIKFNYRVLDQALHAERNIFDKLKFFAITASNLDEFCTIRLGSLYNYIDYGKERFDYSGLRETPFKVYLLKELQKYVADQNEIFINELKPHFETNKFKIATYPELSVDNRTRVNQYFQRTIFPMLTPMLFDNYHAFPTLKNNRILFGVVTKEQQEANTQLRVSFIQIPSNIPRFFEILTIDQLLLFVPTEEIIRHNIHHLFRNVEIKSTNLFRINRNGDFTLEESEDIESNFLEELKKKLKTRKSGRVVRLDIEENPDPWLLRLLKIQWDLDELNVFRFPSNCILDYTGLNQIVKHNELKPKLQVSYQQVNPLSFAESGTKDLFEILKERDILMHHPYNSMNPVLELLEKAADDPFVLSIKITIYRLSRNDSRVSAALLRAAENEKHVSVLFEVKARFDEENNLREAKRLQQAGCYVIYGIGSLKTHTKLLLIVRNEPGKVYRYVHLSSGNYNETTARFYTDIGLLSTNEIYANDVSEFFNVITGHSHPTTYKNLITSPRDMRNQLMVLVKNEANNARLGKKAGIIIKINSLQDNDFINCLYEASQAGVSIKLIVRGMCCLRPRRKGLSENIQVTSIVGEYLEHSRIYYFHNENDPKIYIGSADAMVRSFDRRIESLFLLESKILCKQVIGILHYHLKDNVNSYTMLEDGRYVVKELKDETPFNSHKEFYFLNEETIESVNLF